MKDKYTYDLIEGLDNIENLDIDYYDLINDEELKTMDIDVENINLKTYEKIGLSKIKKFKTKKIVNIVASISLILLIGTPVTLGFVSQLYKYDKSSGNIIKSDAPLYVLKNSISKKVGNGEITINSFVVNTKDKNLTINEVANNIQGYEYYKEDIILNGENITNSTYEKFKNGWNKHTGTYFDEEGNYEFKYIVTLLDKDKKTTKVEFDIELEEATSVEEYNKNLPKSIKNNIVVSAMNKEIDNNLYVELMAIPNIESMNFTVDNYGNYINDNKGSNICLIDANGKKGSVN